MTSPFRVAINEPVTVPDFLQPVRDFFWRHPNLLPTGHSDSYNRKLLSGDRPLSCVDYLAALTRMMRRQGRDAVAAAVNAWLPQFDLVAVQYDSAPVKPLREEVYEACEATSAAFARVFDAISDGAVSPAERRDINTRIAAAQAQLADVQRAIALEVAS